MRSRQRPAFTLVEVLVVALIIIVLMGLLLVGVQRAMSTGRKVQATTDIAQLSSAIGAFKAHFRVDHVPSRFFLVNDRAYYTTSSGRFLKQMYPRARWIEPDPATGEIGTAARMKLMGVQPGSTVTLEGPQCLVFFLAGPPDPTTGIPRGWGMSPVDPFATTNAAGDPIDTVTPFFQFPADRLLIAAPNPPSGSMLKSFADPWGHHYLYFSDDGRGLGYYPVGVIARPEELPAVVPEVLYRPGTDAPFDPVRPASPYSVAGRPVNPNSYQIISAGPDTRFNGGAGDALPVGDDIANFGQ
jgi:type II secretory pathway pseudopilin PulG